MAPFRQPLLRSADGTGCDFVSEHQAPGVSGHWPSSHLLTKPAARKRTGLLQMEREAGCWFYKYVQDYGKVANNRKFELAEHDVSMACEEEKVDFW